MAHDGGKIRVLRAAEQLRAVQMRDGLGSGKPGMRFRACDARAEVERETVIGAAFGDLGVERGQMERRHCFILQADMRQHGILGHTHFDDRIVQITTIADRQLQQGQARTACQMDRVARVEGGAIAGDADQQQQTGIDVGRYRQHCAVLCQHRVQRDHRLTVGARERAEVRVIGKAGELHAGRQRGQFAPEAAIDEHDARRVDTRQTGEQNIVTARCQHLHERRVGNRAEGGIFPRLLTPTGRRTGQASAAERSGGGGADPGIARQPTTQCLIMREEPSDARLHWRGHAASATMPA